MCFLEWESLETDILGQMMNEEDVIELFSGFEIISFLGSLTYVVLQ